MCHLTMIKLLTSFGLMFAGFFFYQILLFFVTQTHPSFIKIVHVFDLHSIEPERSLCGTVETGVGACDA